MLRIRLPRIVYGKEISGQVSALNLPEVPRFGIIAPSCAKRMTMLMDCGIVYVRGVWMNFQDELDKHDKIRDKLRMTFIKFVRNELDISLTFAEVALRAENNPAKKERSQSNARKAYDSALRFSRKFSLPHPEAEKFAEELRHLRSILQLLGESNFPS